MTPKLGMRSILSLAVFALLAAAGCRSDVKEIVGIIEPEPAWKTVVIQGEPPLSGSLPKDDSPIYIAAPIDETDSKILIYADHLSPILIVRERIREPVGFGELYRFASETYQVELYYFEASPGESIARKDNGHLLAGLNLWGRWRATPVVPGAFGVADSPFGAMGFVRFKPVFGLSCFTALQYLDPKERPEGHFGRVFRMYYCKRTEILQESEIRSAIAGIGVVGLNEPSPSLLSIAEDGGPAS